MIITNPIFNLALRPLLENERVAKFFIETILDQPIHSLEVMPMEQIDGERCLSIDYFECDYSVAILTDTGEAKKTFIKIQKVMNLVDLWFSGKYEKLCEKKNRISSEKVDLPTTIIYVLGSDLPEVETACIKVEVNHQDLINKTELLKKNDFLENLPHGSYVIQVGKITGRYHTRLDKLLSVFEQTDFEDDRKIVKEFAHETDLEEVKLMTDILHQLGTTLPEKKKIENEQEVWRTVNVQLDGQREEFLEALKEKDQALEENAKALIEKDKLIEELLKKLNEKGG